MQIKTTMRYHHTLVQMTIIKSQKMASIGEDVGCKRKFLHTVGGNKN
jgi:hypothetical protein